MTARSANMHTEPIAAAPLYAKLRDSLRAEIRAGRYRDGSPMPSEASLGRRFGVSRITVRQALSELCNEGLIYKVNGRGSFVDAPKAHQSLQRLEGFGEAMSRLGFSSTNRVLRMREIAAAPAIAARLAVAPGKPVTEIIWVRILDAAPFCYEISYVPTDIGALLPAAELARRDMFAILEEDHGMRLGNAELRIEAILASAVHAKHLGTRLGQPCLRIERLTRRANGAPVNFDFLTFRGDAFQYRITIEREYPARKSPVAAPLKPPRSTRKPRR